MAVCIPSKLTFSFALVVCITTLYFACNIKQHRKSLTLFLKRNPVEDKTTARFTPTLQFIHQSWKTKNLPPRFEKWASSWKSCFPNATYMLWTDEENDNFIKRYYPWFYLRYRTLPLEINRIDVVRYFYLLHFGGLYTDLDNECLRPFDHLLANATIAFASMEGKKNVAEGYIQNSFMYSVKRHTFWLELIHYTLYSKANTVDELTGPKALSKAVNEYRARLKGTREITVYPPNYFNPFSWQRRDKDKHKCRDYNRMTDKELAVCRNLFVNSSYVVQYHTHVWEIGRGGRIL